MLAHHGEQNTAVSLIHTIHRATSSSTLTVDLKGSDSTKEKAGTVLDAI